MTNTSTKRALLTSLLALVLCVAMLASTTYAWFTDTASTGINKITSGNLDVELKYSKDYTTWENAEGATDIFSASKWEPGYTEVVYFKVTNAGSLAFNYKVAPAISKETNGTNKENVQFKLSDYLLFDIVGVTEAFATRDAARTAITAPKNFSEFSTDSAILEEGASQVFAMVVWMPEETGDEANHNGISPAAIDFSIKVVASQATVEEDSFDNEYDEGARFPGEKITVDSDTALADVIEQKVDYAVVAGEEPYKKTVTADGVKVDIKGGKFENQIIAARNGAVVTIMDATAGSVEEGGGPNIIANVNSGSKVIINGGSYLTTTVFTGDGSGTAEITGGYFDCGMLYLALGKKPLADLTITGGTFSSMMVKGQGMMAPYIADFVPDTHKIVNNADGSATVVAK